MLIKDTDFVVVGPLGRELEDETKKLSYNLKTDYARKGYGFCLCS